VFSTKSVDNSVDYLGQSDFKLGGYKILQIGFKTVRAAVSLAVQGFTLLF